VAANGKTATTGQVGNWKFSPAPRQYDSVSNSIPGEDYTAVIVGEVSGDWTPVQGSAEMLTEKDETEDRTESPSDLETDESFQAANKVEDSAMAETEISLPEEISAAVGETIMIPVRFANYTGKTISAYSFVVNFDPAVLQPDSAQPIERSATVSEEFAVVHSIESKRGQIRIAAANGGDGNRTAGINGVLLKLRFQVIGANTSKRQTAAALKLAHSAIIEDHFGAALNVKKTNGSVRIIANSNPSLMTGREVSADGRGVRSEN
jgi:hypothetical protein